MIWGEGILCGNFEKRDELLRCGFKASVSGTAVGSSTAIPSILYGEGASGLRLYGLCTFDVTCGCAYDDIRKKIAALNRGLCVKKFDALDARSFLRWRGRVRLGGSG